MQGYQWLCTKSIRVLIRFHIVIVSKGQVYSQHFILTFLASVPNATIRECTLVDRSELAGNYIQSEQKQQQIQRHTQSLG